MKLIGITGPTGAGKTTALRELIALGAEIIDADAVYHQLLASDQSLNDELCARFPSVYVEGVLDRKALGNIVFHDETALADLNRITIYYVNRETTRRIEAARAAGRIGVGLDAINLIGSDMAQLCDATVAIVAPDALRIPRIMARDNISEEYARSRIAAQKPCAYFSEHCDHTLENDGDPADFARRANELFTLLLR